MTDEHPFAPFVRILGKGPNLFRHLTAEETEEAVGMIMAGRVEPVQLGAFLCLLRVQTETPEEVAGFVRAVKATIEAPAAAVDLDWPSYAGKGRQLPWFVLSALLLAGEGIRVFMHGADGHTAGRVYARQALEALGIPIAKSLEEGAAQLTATNFAFLPLEHLCPRLHEIMGLKSLLGVRSPVHTIARKINPFDAPAQLLSVAHPAYRDVHQQAALLLGQPRMAVFKGEGGEAERRPGKKSTVYSVSSGETSEEVWPPLLDQSTPEVDEDLDLSRLGPVWRGEAEDAYGEAAVTGSAAIALRLLGRASSVEEADALAAQMWQGRKP